MEIGKGPGEASEIGPFFFSNSSYTPPERVSHASRGPGRGAEVRSYYSFTHSLTHHSLTQELTHSLALTLKRTVALTHSLRVQSGVFLLS